MGEVDGLVGMQEIAERLHVQHRTVLQWRWQRLMPTPVGMVSRVPLWYWADIEVWARATGRL
jgi:hypothetical protein